MEGGGASRSGVRRAGGGSKSPRQGLPPRCQQRFRRRRRGSEPEIVRRGGRKREEVTRGRREREFWAGKYHSSEVLAPPRVGRERRTSLRAAADALRMLSTAWPRYGPVLRTFGGPSVALQFQIAQGIVRLGYESMLGVFLTMRTRLDILFWRSFAARRDHRSIIDRARIRTPSLIASGHRRFF